MVGRGRVREAGRVVRGDGTWRWEDEVGRSRGIREGSGRVLTLVVPAFVSEVHPTRALRPGPSYIGRPEDLRDVRT